MASPESGPSHRGPDALRELMEEFEAQLAQGMERLVAGEAFSELLVAMAENAVAVWRISTDLWDLVWRGMRLPARADFDRLARQQGRTEDKLELVLQAVERLQDRDVATGRARAADRARAGSARAPRTSERPRRPTERVTSSERIAAWAASPAWRPSPD